MLASLSALLFLNASAPEGDGEAVRLQIPLCKGLTIVTAINEEEGDYESIKQVIRADAGSVTLAYSADVPVATGEEDPIAALFGASNRPKASSTNETQSRSNTRKIRREDLETAHEYRAGFRTGVPEEFYPGTTAFGVSASVLRELKTRGQTRLNVWTGRGFGGLEGFINGLLNGSEATDKGLAGTLKTVESDSIPFKVLVNNKPVELPAIHARGLLGGEDAELWILDDSANPIALRYTFGDRRLQVIKLSYPVSEAPLPSDQPPPAVAGAVTGSPSPSRIEEDLAKDGRTVIYGIYFDFASDRIKKESDAVLTEIAAVLQQNPAWKLAVEGHTDNIGGDAYNLDLSKRRAAAVKQALVTRYQIDGNRLQTGGYGASAPKDTNETLEGRARNRRVELAKVG